MDVQIREAIQRQLTLGREETMVLPDIFIVNEVMVFSMIKYFSIMCIGSYEVVARMVSQGFLVLENHFRRQSNPFHAMVQCWSQSPQLFHHIVVHSLVEVLARHHCSFHSSYPMCLPGLLSMAFGFHVVGVHDSGIAGITKPLLGTLVGIPGGGGGDCDWDGGGICGG